MNIKRITLNIAGMTCDHCARSVEKALDAEGILEKRVSYPQASGTVVFDPSKIDAGRIERLINDTGHYRVTGLDDANGAHEGESANKHLVIIGGGSAAFAATTEAVSRGARVTMINDGLPIGGTCVNVGCVPSKNLLRAAESLHRAQKNPFEGIETQGKLKNISALMEQKRSLVGQLRREKYIDVVKDLPGFRLVEGRGRFVGPNEIEVNGETIKADVVLIAAGARPALPDIPGLSEVDYLTNASAFELEKLPESLIVLGGRYVALELAQLFSRLGSKVTVLQRSQRILPTESADITEALSGYLQQEGIRIVTGNALQRIRQNSNEIVVETRIDGRAETFTAEKLLVATGRRANTDGLDLETAGVETDRRGFIKTNDYLQTTTPHIFAAGDILGENMFVYTAAYEGKLAVVNALSAEKQKRDYTALPWVVFTDPQVAGVGPDEEQAKQQGIEAESAVLPLDYVPRALAARDTRGVIKLIRDKKTDRLIGARILAAEGSELLMEAALAIKFGITVEQIKEMFHPYLTLSEGIKLAAITFSKSVKELSCCAT
ncbi:MAG TPA: mercury(II) reductase [Caldithrix abyssi]|uniref:Mercuric reductase n=1 Tax=Caldithrix abyssi TaxID=187145 RepID=A0A7V4UFU1_CALAY|nr:mercury(II) reductase [Caldithrix abyssi]